MELNKDEGSGNHLALEKSPYLRQHATNPVDWRPWSAETLELARREDRPLFISIGYSTCHWCHVMERESFEDEGTARVLNDNFICVKVDREERPDVDALYMRAVQALTGRGGWPLNVFATPDGEPFYGGTYFPPSESGGLPAFRDLVRVLGESYRTKRGHVTEVTREIKAAVERLSKPMATVELGGWLGENAVEVSQRYFDPVGKGFGAGPKFPMAMFLGFLLKHHRRTGDEASLDIATSSLDAMARGGIRDHLGGGFHRYAVDSMWNVPHFEKMLYDNAQLLGLYSEAYAMTESPLYQGSAMGIAGYLTGRMRSPEGGFFAAEDADSEGGEGAFYLWSPEEVRSVLGESDGRCFCEYYNVTEPGNCEGKSTLRISPGAELELPCDIKRLSGVLSEAREMRPPPMVDKKVIVSWNGLAASALARASDVFEDPDLLGAAERCADFACSMRDESGRLLRYSLDGHSDIGAGLEDYALLGTALVDIYTANRDGARLRAAEALAGEMLERFADTGSVLLLDSAPDRGGLFANARDLADTDLPSGNSAAAGFLLALSRVTGSKEFRRCGTELLSAIEGMADEPLSHGYALSMLEDLLVDWC